MTGPERGGLRHDELTGHDVLLTSVCAQGKPTAGQVTGPCPFCGELEHGQQDAVVDRSGAVPIPYHRNPWPLAADAAAFVVLLGEAHHAHPSEVSGPEWTSALVVALRLAGTTTHGQVLGNLGAGSGSSVEHLHLQVVGLGAVPPLLRREARSLHGAQCLLCHTHIGAPLTLPGGPLRVVVADAAATGEVRVVGGHHGTPTAAELAALGAVLPLLFGAYAALGWADAQLALHAGEAGADFHWHLHVRPVAGPIGMLETLLGLSVVRVASEQVAARLNRALRSAPGRSS